MTGAALTPNWEQDMNAHTTKPGSGKTVIALI
jgi:hypothetical protein